MSAPAVGAGRYRQSRRAPAGDAWAILDAMAAGRPVVATQTPDREGLIDHEGGLACSPDRRTFPTSADRSRRCWMTPRAGRGHSGRTPARRRRRGSASRRSRRRRTRRRVPRRPQPGPPSPGAWRRGEQDRIRGRTLRHLTRLLLPLSPRERGLGGEASVEPADDLGTPPHRQPPLSPPPRRSPRYRRPRPPTRRARRRRRRVGPRRGSRRAVRRPGP